MLEGFPRFVHGLACLAALCGVPRPTLAEEPRNTASDAIRHLGDAHDDEEADDDDDLEDDAFDGTESEREYIVRPPTVHRPEACHQELQAQVRVAGTMYDARHPERSMVLMGPASAPTALYRCGAKFGQLELLEVRPHAVLVSTNAEESPCWLKMARPNPNAPPPPPAAPPPSEEQRKKEKRDRKRAFTPEELQAGIQQIGPGIYRVDRSMLDRALARVPKLARTTRTRTVKNHGRPVGISLKKIEEGGLFEHLGLKRGDVLKTVNGFDMSSIDGMLSAKSQLSNAPRLSLSLVRQGQPMTLEYRVQ